VAGEAYKPEEKTKFSSADLKRLPPAKNYILCGIEAHVCVLQTAKDLTLAGKRVVVANDAISSRSIYDFSTAIGEMKEWCRISSVETILYELIRDASSPDFKQCLPLFKSCGSGCGCS
jgi:isochorismate hydrolase